MAKNYSIIQNTGAKLNNILKRDAEGEFNKLQTGFNTHAANHSNPHSVTKEQVGLGNVENVSVSDSINSHNIASNAHSDIRTLINNEEKARKAFEYYGDSSIEPSECFEFEVGWGEYAIVTGVKENAEIPAFGPAVIPYEYVENEVAYPVEIIDENAFKNNEDLSNILLPKTIKTIDPSAFEGCTELSEINLLNVDSIANRVFKNCVHLTKASISSGFSSFGTIGIASDTFYGCTNLEEIYISQKIQTIGSNAFYGCSNLTTVYFEGSKEQWDAITIESGNDILDSTTIYYNYSDGSGGGGGGGTTYTFNRQFTVTNDFVSIGNEKSEVVIDLADIISEGTEGYLVDLPSDSAAKITWKGSSDIIIPTSIDTTAGTGRNKFAKIISSVSGKLISLPPGVSYIPNMDLTSVEKVEMFSLLKDEYVDKEGYVYRYAIPTYPSAYSTREYKITAIESEAPNTSYYRELINGSGVKYETFADIVPINLFYTDSGNNDGEYVAADLTTYSPYLRAWDSKTGANNNTYYRMKTRNAGVTDYLEMRNRQGAWVVFPSVIPTSNDDTPYLYTIVKDSGGNLTKLKTVSYTEFMLDNEVNVITMDTSGRIYLKPNPNLNITLNNQGYMFINGEGAYKNLYALVKTTTAQLTKSQTTISNTLRTYAGGKLVFVPDDNVSIKAAYPTGKFYTENYSILPGATYGDLNLEEPYGGHEGIIKYQVIPSASINLGSGIIPNGTLTGRTTPFPSVLGTKGVLNTSGGMSAEVPELFAYKTVYDECTETHLIRRFSDEILITEDMLQSFTPIPNTTNAAIIKFKVPINYPENTPAFNDANTAANIIQPAFEVKSQQAVEDTVWAYDQNAVAFTYPAAADDLEHALVTIATVKGGGETELRRKLKTCQYKIKYELAAPKYKYNVDKLYINSNEYAYFSHDEQIIDLADIIDSGSEGYIVNPPRDSIAKITWKGSSDIAVPSSTGTGINSPSNKFAKIISSKSGKLISLPAGASYVEGMDLTNVVDKVEIQSLMRDEYVDKDGYVYKYVNPNYVATAIEADAAITSYYRGKIDGSTVTYQFYDDITLVNLFYRDNGNYTDATNLRAWTSQTGQNGNVYYSSYALHQWTTSWSDFPNIRPSSNDEVPYFYVTLKKSNGDLVQFKPISYNEFMVDNELNVATMDTGGKIYLKPDPDLLVSLITSSDVSCLAINNVLAFKNIYALVKMSTNAPTMSSEDPINNTIRIYAGGKLVFVPDVSSHEEISYPYGIIDKNSYVPYKEIILKAPENTEAALNMLQPITTNIDDLNYRVENIEITKELGKIGTGDGVTDDTEAIQDAIKQAENLNPSYAREVVLTSGIYRISSPLKMNVENLTLRGEGEVILWATEGNYQPIIRVMAGGCKIENLKIYLAKTNDDVNYTNNETDPWLWGYTKSYKESVDANAEGDGHYSGIYVDTGLEYDSEGNYGFFNLTVRDVTVQGAFRYSTKFIEKSYGIYFPKTGYCYFNTIDNCLFNSVMCGLFLGSGGTPTDVNCKFDIGDDIYNTGASGNANTFQFKNCYNVMGCRYGAIVYSISNTIRIDGQSVGGDSMNPYVYDNNNREVPLDEHTPSDYRTSNSQAYEYVYDAEEQKYVFKPIPGDIVSGFPKNVGEWRKVTDAGIVMHGRLNKIEGMIFDHQRTTYGGFYLSSSSSNCLYNSYSNGGVSYGRSDISWANHMYIPVVKEGNIYIKWAAWDSIMSSAGVTDCGLGNRNIDTNMLENEHKYGAGVISSLDKYGMNYAFPRTIDKTDDVAAYADIIGSVKCYYVIQDNDDWDEVEKEEITQFYIGHPSRNVTTSDISPLFRPNCDISPYGISTGITFEQIPSHEHPIIIEIDFDQRPIMGISSGIIRFNQFIGQEIGFSLYTTAVGDWSRYYNFSNYNTNGEFFWNMYNHNTSQHARDTIEKIHIKFGSAYMPTLQNAVTYYDGETSVTYAAGTNYNPNGYVGISKIFIGDTNGGGRAFLPRGGGDVYGNINASGILESKSGTIKLGNTTLTEQQLQSLLAIIS